MRTLMTCIALLSCFSPIFSTVALAADNDQAIMGRIDEFQAAWNKNDAKAMAALWTEDGTLINPVGRFASGPADIEKVFVDEHAQMFKDTTYKVSEVKIQSITPDVMVADVTANISGIHAADGSAAPDYLHHVTWVFVKKDGKWMTAAARPYQFMKPAEPK
jgi:uncharacterized protein (TIGR02246 family)